MIAYEELCDALARWRTKNGLANGPAAAARAPRTSTPMAAAAPPPAFAQAVTAQNAPPYEDRTSTTTSAAPPVEGSTPKRDDATGEIDIDNIDVVEENDV